VFAAWVGLSREAEAYLEPTFAASFDSEPGLGAAVAAVAGHRRDLENRADRHRRVLSGVLNVVAAIRNIDRKLVEVGRSMASAACNWCGGFCCPPPCPACSPGCAAA
jgi:sulfonate transport system permease protein